MPRTMIVISAFAALLPFCSAAWHPFAAGAEIVARGTVESANSVAIQSPVTATILEITPEGPIKRNGIVAVLDSAPFAERVEAQEIELAKLHAELVRAERELKSSAAVRESELKLAAHRLAVAKLRRETFDAEIELKVKQLNTSHDVARAKVAFAERQVESSQRAPAAEREAVKLALTEARAARETLQAEDLFFRESASKLQLAELELQVGQRSLELLLLKQTSPNLGRSELRLETVKQLTDVATRQLKRYQSQVAFCQVKAPISGMLLHSRGRGVELKVGARIREGQTIAELPDLSRLQLKVLVPEEQIPQVRVGQPCQVSLDAFPEETMKGKVVLVSPTAEQLEPKTQSKKYRATVSIVDPPEGSRIGLTGSVRIRVAD